MDKQQNKGQRLLELEHSGSNVIKIIYVNEKQAFLKQYIYIYKMYFSFERQRNKNVVSLQKSFKTKS